MEPFENSYSSERAPKFLSCFVHTYCAKCIAGLAKKNGGEQGKPVSILCPVKSVFVEAHFHSRFVEKEEKQQYQLVDQAKCLQILVCSP